MLRAGGVLVWSFTGGFFIYPAWKAKTLGQAVDDEDVVLIDVFDVVGGRDDGAVTVAGVVVAAVEFVHD
jgi:hypothetical protein